MTSLSEFLSRLVRCSAGSALVEATIYVPIAISLMAGGVDFGMAFSAHATVGKSVRDAGRFLGSFPSRPTPVACSDWAITKAKNLAIYGKLSPAAGDLPLISGWQTSDVTVSFNPADCSTEDYKITVSATAQYSTLALGAVLPGIGTLPLRAQHVESAGGFDGDLPP